MNTYIARLLAVVGRAAVAGALLAMSWHNLERDWIKSATVECLAAIVLLLDAKRSLRSAEEELERTRLGLRNRDR